VAWTAAISGLGLILTGWANKNTVMFSSGVAATVVAFIPRARAKFVYEVANSWTMKQGWKRVPESERPLVPDDEPAKSLKRK